MSTKKYNPITPSLRYRVTNAYTEITTDKPEKSLLVPQKRSGGRNQKGEMTMRYIGGGHKKQYRIIDFKRNKIDIPATVKTIEYDPNRTARIALLSYADGEKRYVLIPKNMTAGSAFIVSDKADLTVGNRMKLSNIPAGTFVYNLEVKPNAGAKLVRSAGNYAQVVAHNNGFTQVKLPSTEVRMIPDTAFATIGEVSNTDHHLVKLGKAGRNRWLGVRPTTRGSAMNPVDHPYGGGEGKQRRGTKRPKTKWGKTTGGRKTRTPKKYSNVHIVSRRQNGVRNKESKL